jgi:hypothetical protein
MTAKTAPSGMVLDVRELTARAGRYLTNEKLVRDNEIEDHILNDCCGPTCLEPGPYSFADGKIVWDETLIGDRTWLMIAIRAETYPDELYTCPLRCPNVPACGRKFEWDVDLEELLKDKTFPLSAEARERMKSGQMFELVVPKKGNKLRYKLKTGGDRKRFMATRASAKANGNKKRQERENDLVNGFLFYGVEIEGVDKKNRDGRQDFLESLGFRGLNQVRGMMELNDCGIETTIEAKCPHCGQEFDFELPFARREFLAPPTQRRKTTAELRAEAEAAEDDAES